MRSGVEAVGGSEGHQEHDPGQGDETPQGQKTATDDDACTS
jgi:hypothetical protein